MFEALRGVWLSRGYGWVLEIEADDWVRWDVTEKTAFRADWGDASDFLVGFDRIEAVSSRRFGLYAAGEITRYAFDRLAEPPKGCRGGGTPQSDDPEINFDAFYQQFLEHYALFDLKGVDWSELYARHRDLVSAEIGEDRLLDLLAEMIAPLRDNHVAIVAPGRAIKATKIGRQRGLVEKTLGTGPYWSNRDESNRKLCSLLDRELLGGRGRSACNDLLLWGELAPGIGYLAVLGMFAFADSDRARQSGDLPQRRREGAEFLRADLAALEPALDRALAELWECGAIVVDARINGGGFDVAALAIAGRFADRRRLAFTKAARNGDAFEPTQSIFVEPSGPSQYVRPVYLLTSPLTGSAAEIFTLGMMAMPHVTRVGEPTLGILSDDLHKRLPNGWEVSLSNEIYRAPDGSLYEDRGIPPQVEAPVFFEDRLVPGLRLAVERAIALADAATR